jgi:hypothetical protein
VKKINLFKEKHYYWGFLFILFCFFLMKIPMLNLPFHLDEASIYKGVETILKNGFSPFIEWWGYHPPVFYELFALWENFWGFSRQAFHLVIVFFACLSIYFSFLIAKVVDGIKSGFWVAVLLIFNPIFFAQSGMFHITMMLTAFSMMSLYFYFTDRNKLFLLTSILLVLTKEPGILIPGVILAVEVFGALKDRFSLVRLIKTIAFWSLPLVVFVFWMGLNKVFLGWFLWPQFLSNMPWETGDIFEKFKITFLVNFQWVIIVSLIISWLKLYLEKGRLSFNTKLSASMSKKIIFFTLPLLPFVVFCLLMWGSFLPRYIVFVYPPFLIYFVLLVRNMFKKEFYQACFFAFIALLFAFSWVPSKKKNITWNG